MSEDENEKKPIKLKLSAKGKETDGEKQGDARQPARQIRTRIGRRSTSETNAP